MASDTRPPDDTESPALFDLAPQRPSEGYRVLARKYRPQRFEDLIGQEAMVRTLSNAFRSGRIAHAFMLTGVRGVGKTTTARIIARALNYDTDDGAKGPTTEMAKPGKHCALIAESRHPDVMELDAASRTGINDIRELIDGVRYAPAMARYKVYIIDEVHMLSVQAFNGLLKTLEEPPPHVKFVFATTEIRKVPVTVLSRCQRFDLRRIERDVLIAHLARIAALEAVKVEEGALSLIARAAEGSVRDSLSLLDQAIAEAGGGEVSAEAVKGMLGLADRARVVDLFAAALEGRAGDGLAIAEDFFRIGADPVALMQDLAALTHALTRLKLLPGAETDLPEAPTEGARLKELAGRVGAAHLARAWQLLLKGIGEVQAAPQAAMAAEMVIVRLAHLADLPSPEDIIRKLGAAPSAATARPNGAATASSATAAAASERSPRGPAGSGRSGSAALGTAPNQAQAAPSAPARPQPRSFEAVVRLAVEARDVELARALQDDVRLVSFEAGRIALAPGPRAASDLSARLAKALQAWTGERWFVLVSSAEAGKATLREERKAEDDRLKAEAAEDPLVQAALTAFPGARIVAVREIERASAPAADREDDETDTD